MFNYRLLLFVLFLFIAHLGASERMPGFTAHYLYSPGYYQTSQPNTHSETQPSALVVDGGNLVEYQNKLLGIWSLDGYYRHKDLFNGMFTQAIPSGRRFDGRLYSVTNSENYAHVSVAGWHRSFGTDRRPTSYYGVVVFGKHPTTEQELQNVNELTPIRIYEGQVWGRKNSDIIHGIATVEIDATNDVARYSIQFPDMPEIAFETKNSYEMIADISHPDYASADVKSLFYGENAEEIGGALQIAHKNGFRITAVLAMKHLNQPT